VEKSEPMQFQMVVQLPPLEDQEQFDYVNHLTVQGSGSQVFIFWGQAPMPMVKEHADSVTEKEGVVQARPVAHLTMHREFFDEVVDLLVRQRDNMRQGEEEPGEA